MDIGSGIAIGGTVASVAFSVMGCVIAHIKAKNPPPAGEGKTTCYEHSGVAAVLKSLQDGQELIRGSIDRIFSILDERKHDRG